MAFLFFRQELFTMLHFPTVAIRVICGQQRIMIIILRNALSLIIVQSEKMSLCSNLSENPPLKRCLYAALKIRFGE